MMPTLSNNKAWSTKNKDFKNFKDLKDPKVLKVPTIPKYPKNPTIPKVFKVFKIPTSLLQTSNYRHCYSYFDE